MRYINAIFTALLGETWDNRRLLAQYEPLIDRLPADARVRVREFVRLQLVGQRARRIIPDDFIELRGFARRAAAFEASADRALDALVAQITPAAEAASITFDAVLSTTATGNLMPGLSYRLACRIPGLVRSDSLMLDLSNVGCTGGLKALNLARTLDPAIRNVLVVAVEVPTTLVDTTSDRLDTWQGNCTFGDGSAAVWVSTDAGQRECPLQLEAINFRQSAETGLDLIRWAYGDYYSFAVRDARTFDADVRGLVLAALAESDQAAWEHEPRWAIHPAGLSLLVRLRRHLGIPEAAIRPSVEHFRTHSNMSSVSLLDLLRELAIEAPPGSAINLLTMGAGFNVIHGRVRRLPAGGGDGT